MLNRISSLSLITAAMAVAAALAGCGNKPGESTGSEYAPNMFHSIANNGFHYTVREDGTYKNQVFKDGMNAQRPPKGTVPRSESWLSGETYTAYNVPNTPEGYEFANANVRMPDEIRKDSAKNVTAGKVLFERFCAVCHGAAGKGDGSIVSKGAYPAIPAYTHGFKGDETGKITEGRMYHTLTYGKNNMGSYASQVTPKERWQIISYLKYLQTLP